MASSTVSYFFWFTLGLCLAIIPSDSLVPFWHWLSQQSWLVSRCISDLIVWLPKISYSGKRPFPNSYLTGLTTQVQFCCFWDILYCVHWRCGVPGVCPSEICTFFRSHAITTVQSRQPPNELLQRTSACCWLYVAVSNAGFYHVKTLPLCWGECLHWTVWGLGPLGPCASHRFSGSKPHQPGVGSCLRPCVLWCSVLLPAFCSSHQFVGFRIDNCSME